MQEQKTYKQLYYKQYYERNKVAIIIKHALAKQMMYANESNEQREARLALGRAKREAKKDHVNAVKREYQKANGTRQNAVKRAWRQRNKDKLNARMDCPCGGHYMRHHKYEHGKTRQHIKWEEAQCRLDVPSVEEVDEEPDGSSSGDSSEWQRWNWIETIERVFEHPFISIMDSGDQPRMHNHIAIIRLSIVR